MDNIRPIKTERDYEWALVEISGYFDKPPSMGARDAERFDALARLIEAYEYAHHPIEAPSNPMNSHRIAYVVKALSERQMSADVALCLLKGCFNDMAISQKQITDTYVAEMIEDVLLGEIDSDAAVTALSEAAAASRAGA